jgi:flagellar biogenesis protein FliO
MPRSATIFTIVFWGCLVGPAEAQSPPSWRTPGKSAVQRLPAQPNIFGDDERSASIPNIKQALARPEPILRGLNRMPAQDKSGSDESSQENADEPAPLPMPDPTLEPLPVPPPPPIRDEAVLPATYQERTEIVVENSSPQEVGGAVPSEKPLAAGGEKTPLSPQNHAKMPLSTNGKAGAGNADKSASGIPSMISVSGSTGVVLGIFLLLVWLVRKKTPQALVRLPGEAFEILGRAPLAGRQQVQLLRCGSRLLLVSVTPGGAETLTEITDPVEVDRLAGLCKQGQPGSSSAAFKQIFEQLAPRRLARNDSARQGEEEYEPTAASYSRGVRAWEDRNV